MPVGKVKYLQCLRDTDATPYETMPWVQLPHCKRGREVLAIVPRRPRRRFWR